MNVTNELNKTEIDLINLNLKINLNINEIITNLGKTDNIFDNNIYNFLKYNLVISNSVNLFTTVFSNTGLDLLSCIFSINSDFLRFSNLIKYTEFS
jgi:hypothetical protein